MSTSVPDPTGQQQDDASSAEQDASHKRSRSPVQVAIVSQVPPSPNTEAEATDDQKTPRWKIVLEFFALIVAVVVAAIYGGQLWVMKRQLEEMRSTTASTEQAAYAACVSAQVAKQSLAELQAGGADTHNLAAGSVAQANAVTLAESPYILLDTAATMPPLIANESFAAPLRVNNAGSSPAHNIMIRAVVGLYEEGKEPPFTYDPGKVGTLYVGSVAKGAESTYPIRIGSGHKVSKVSDAQVRDFNAGKIYLATYAEATYSDVFGLRHLTRMCRVYEEPLPDSVFLSKGRHHRCAHYNSSDSNKLLSQPKPVPNQPQLTSSFDLDCKKPENH